MEFNLLLKNIENIGEFQVYPFNQYISCPMLRSKSIIFGNKSNKILDFNKILTMFFIEFYKRAIKKDNLVN